MSFLQLLEEEAGSQLGPRGREYLKTAVEGGRRMQVLIGALLAYARVGHGEPQREAVDMDALLREVVADLEIAIEEAEGRVTWDRLPVVEGERERLRPVLQNLVENALRFRGAAPARVHVAARREGRGWRFSVRDEGIGIDPAHHEAVFEVFRRLHPRERYPGTGIGLAVVKKLVEAEGGRVEVESRAGEGAVFSFMVPDAPAEPGPYPLASSSEAPEGR